MTRESWLAYRLQVVSAWPDSPRRAAHVAAIEHELAALRVAA